MNHIYFAIWIFPVIFPIDSSFLANSLTIKRISSLKVLSSALLPMSMECWNTGMAKTGAHLRNGLIIKRQNGEFGCSRSCNG